MGILTSPTLEENPKKTFIMKHHVKLISLLIICSIAWLSFLAHDNFSSNTYFSENALLPGLVQGEYSEDAEAQEFLLEIEVEARKYPLTIPDKWLVEKFKQIFLETYVHNFALTNPLKEDMNFTGSNVYGILRAPRSSSLEALILSVPYRPPSSIYPATNAGLALMYSLARYFRRQKYWAKDIIFLVTEHEQLGMQAWLDAYHGTVSGAKGGLIHHGILEEHSGAIQAAINLEIHGPKISHIDVKISGLNGQLPNLDLVNLIHRLCSKEGIKSTFYNKDSKSGTKFSSWYHKIITVLQMMTTQATGVPDGNHGLFHRFGIEAVTIEGHNKVGRGGATFRNMGRVSEGIFRSLNNLLERFHQSFFFYLLPSTDKYISIGFYMPCIAMLVSALFLRSFAIWLRLHVNYEGKSVHQKLFKITVNLNIMVVSCILLVSHAIGSFIFPASNYFIKKLPWSSGKSLVLLYTIVSVISAAFVGILMNKFVKPANWVLLNVICLTELATFLLCASMHNFSFALIVSLIYVIPTLWISVSHNRWYKKLVWILFHPFLLLYWGTLISTVYNFYGQPYRSLLIKSFEAFQHLLALNFIDAVVYGNWTLVVLELILLPVWICFWALLNAQSSPDSKVDTSFLDDKKNE